MARASMAELIVRCRRMIADPAGGSAVFTDDELQEALDAHREDVRYLALTAAESIAPGGGVTVLDYYADVGDWEADEQLVGPSFAVLAPATSDRLTGHWTFASSVLPPVYLTGKHYDLHGAAADILEAWAAKLKLAFDFSEDGQSFKRSQQAALLIDLAMEHRRKQWPTVAQQVRGDLC